jgi:hypothetical protein
MALGIRSLMYHVFAAMGFPEQAPDVFQKAEWAWLRQAAGYPYQILPLTAEWAPEGPALHLKAASILILREASVELRTLGNWALKGTAESLVFRDPDNPLFRYLRDGATLNVKNRVLKRCPATRPSPEKAHRDFQWQRPSRDRVFDQADGHDCIFMINLLLADR